MEVAERAPSGERRAIGLIYLCPFFLPAPPSALFFKMFFCFLELFSSAICPNRAGGGEGGGQ